MLIVGEPVPAVTPRRIGPFFVEFWSLFVAVPLSTLVNLSRLFKVLFGRSRLVVKRDSFSDVVAAATRNRTKRTGRYTKAMKDDNSGHAEEEEGL